MSCIYHLVIQTVIAVPQLTICSYLVLLESTEGLQFTEEKWMFLYSQFHYVIQDQHYLTPTQWTCVPTFIGVKERKQISVILIPTYSSDLRKEGKK